jgi:opacity protein-like surface antigen
MKVLMTGAAAALMTVLSAAPAAPAAAQSVAAKGGSAGLGGELAYGLNSRLAVRGVVYGGTLSRERTESGIRYDAELSFGSVSALLDLHPFAGGLRLSAGLMSNNNRVDFSGRATSGTININGIDYPASAVGELRGDVRFDSTSPYLGLGWGAKPGGRAGLFVSVDAGALFQKPKASLRGSCDPALPAMACAQLQADIAAEEREFQSAVDSFKVYPVISAGIGWRF